MDTEVGVRTILVTTNFGIRPISAVVEYLSNILIEPASMSTKALDFGNAKYLNR